MTVPSSVSGLRIADEAFLVSSTIERCPKTMMLRELIVNAIEAASLALMEKRVEVSGCTIQGVPKLRIRNTGPGMGPDDLYRMCDLASSLGKQNSLDGNFGMGAKVASLPSNKHGLRYRSCKNGSVSEVTLAQRDGIYGRLQSRSAVGELVDVCDVTLECQADADYDLSHDWTEVVLFGNRAAQDTVCDPYDGNPRTSGAGWVAQSLTERFFRLPSGVSVFLAPEIMGAISMGHELTTIAQRSNSFTRIETVETPSGILIHYLYLAPDDAASGSNVDKSGAFEGFGCIVHRGEMYDLRTKSLWSLDAPNFGVSFASKHIYTIVELPDDYLVRAEAYRQFLRFQGGDQRQVFVAEYAELVRSYMPEWLVQVIRSYGPGRADFATEVSEELKTLLANLGVRPAHANPANRQPPPKSPPGAASNDGSPARPAAVNPPLTRGFERPPEIIVLDREDLITERGLQGRVAKFYDSSHQLFVNLRYAAIVDLAEQLVAAERSTIVANRLDELRQVALQSAEWAVTRRVARALVFTLAKKAAGWTAEDVRRAQSPESLSLAADDWLLMLEPASMRLREQMHRLPVVAQSKAA
jgi:hypothetical protein